MTLGEFILNYVWYGKIEVQLRESDVSVESKTVYKGEYNELPLKLNLREVLGIYVYDNVLTICVKADRDEIVEKTNE